MKIVLDPGKTPTAIDLEFTAGKEKGYKNHAIYQLDGDKQAPHERQIWGQQRQRTAHGFLDRQRQRGSPVHPQAGNQMNRLSVFTGTDTRRVRQAARAVATGASGLPSASPSPRQPHTHHPG
jgi:hypothetical protein